MEEIKRRTWVVRMFPNTAACLRLVRALAVEMHENWIEAMQYLNMEPLAEQKKAALRQLGTPPKGGGQRVKRSVWPIPICRI